MTGIGGLDCALGKLLAKPLCGEDELPTTVASSVRRDTARLVARLPRHGCPSPRSQSWRRIKDELDLIQRDFDAPEAGVSPACVGHLRDLVEAARTTLLSAARGT